MVIPDGFFNKCLLPCAFTVGGIALHDVEFAGKRCKLGSVTRGWDLLAEASHLPPEVASLDIMERHKWAFAGRRCTPRAQYRTASRRRGAAMKEMQVCRVMCDV